MSLGLQYRVADAAAALGVGEARVKALIAAGDLRADKLGSQWIIDPADVRRMQRDGRPDGRPWDPARCWDVICSNDRDVVERNAARLFRRGVRHHLRVLPEVIDDLMALDVVVPGGRHAAQSFGAPAPPHVERVDLYVHVDDFAQIVNFAGVRCVSVLDADPNLIVRAVNLPVERWVNPSGSVPVAAAWLDLHESGDRAVSEVRKLMANG